MTSLAEAAGMGDLEGVKKYVRYRGVNAVNTERQTALHCASRNGHFEVVQYLVRDAKAKVNLREKNGYTALRWTSREGPWKWSNAWFEMARQK
jgi:ankyrin repeat protein